MTFKSKLAELRLETSQDNWDGFGAKAIAPEEFDLIEHIAEVIAFEVPGSPEPHPSAGDDGTLCIRWVFNGSCPILDIELAGDKVHCTYQKDGKVESLSSIDEAIELLKR